MAIRQQIGIVVCLLTAALAARQAPPASVQIDYPPDNAYVSGPVVIRASVTPASLAVQRVSFFTDGKLACSVERPPYECAWDAGPRVDEHHIRVVAQLPDGNRLVQNVRTRSAGFTETVNVDAIQVTASVTDGRGRYVHGLSKDAFRLFEDGAPQAIASFASENIPLELIVAMDVSGSMRDAMPKLKSAVKQFLASLRPIDQVTLIAFNENLFSLARPNTDPAGRARNIDRLDGWGGTALYDAIVRGMDTLGRQTGRRALVVFSDGEDQSSHVPLSVAEGRVEASDAVVYTIGQGRATRMKDLQDILERLARVSGGRAFFTDSADRLDEAFTDIVDELSSQYLLGYEPTNPARDGTWRRIRVQVDDRKLTVRAREGYRAVKR